MNGILPIFCIFLGIGFIILDIWLIEKFIILTNDVKLINNILSKFGEDTRSVLADIQSKLERPRRNFGKAPVYGDGVDEFGNEYFIISGININDLNDSFPGNFKGYITPISNFKDTYSISVCNSNDEKLGEVSPGNKPLIDLLKNNKDKLPVHGFINIRNDRNAYKERRWCYGIFYLDINFESNCSKK